ncbi:thiopeptide-type bacteriocin biosynthesis protein [Saccharothrix xinjiangensis]|uniref:Thiopeptide-type bacteriocin biosynthesis protein n=1 Tax=Saccharothrix xinjiangensis TaxID=204798 RepID=A0ABV9XZI2_9PSEU
MPADRLTRASSPAEAAIWRVLAGDDLDTTATTSGLDPDELAAAATIYRQAGRDTLSASQVDSWQQVYLRFGDWARAEHSAAAHLLPVLTRAERSGAITGWWFMRKHPCWRLRMLPGHRHAMAELATMLDDLAAAGHLDAWWPGLYEAETAAFGGPDALDAGHRLFAADSRGVLELAAAGGTGMGRRELSILLCGTLMRDGAALEWYERGDVWDRVSTERPLPSDIDNDRIAAMAGTLKTLALADTAPDGPLFTANGPLAAQSDWATVFRDTGRVLVEANRTGHLTRGLRDVLSYHVIFHWNRLGLTARTQAILAHAARHAILGPTGNTTAPPLPSPTPTSATPADLDQAVIRFPLIQQGRQFCGDLHARVGLVEEHAANSARYDDPDQRINAAAAAWNLAALIAADCDMPDLAEQLCLVQFEIFHQSWPLSGRSAIASQQPLVNLARLAQRTGDPAGCYGTLVRIDHAVRCGGTVDIAGQTIPFTAFIAPGGDRSPVEAWLRRTLREDATRALAAAGDWEKAADHASGYDDTPELLHEARQTRIIALARAGHRDDALRLIDTATTTHPWHHAVASCLRAYADITTGHHDPTRINTLITNIQAARTAAADPVMTLFRIRLGLATAHLAATTHQREAGLLRAEAAEDAHRSGNAYAAREVLDDHADRPSSPLQKLNERWRWA